MLRLPVNSRPGLSARSLSILTFRKHKSLLKDGDAGGRQHGGGFPCCYHRTCIRCLLHDEKEILSIRHVERLSVVEAL